MVILDMTSEGGMYGSPYESWLDSVVKPLNSWTVKLAQFRHFQRRIPRRNDVCAAVGKTQLWAANAVQKLCPNDTRCLLTNALDTKFSTGSLGSNPTDIAYGAFK